MTAEFNSYSVVEQEMLRTAMQSTKEKEEAMDGAQMRQRMEGQLSKFTNVMKGYQFRWFVLDPDAGCLFYYLPEDSRKQKARGCLNLAGAYVAPSGEDELAFTIQAMNGEAYKLRAGGVRERQQWITRLRVVSEYHSRRENIFPPANLTGSARDIRSASSAPPPQSSSDEQIDYRSESILWSPIDDQFRGLIEIIHQTQRNQRELAQYIESLPSQGGLSHADTDLLMLKATSNAACQAIFGCYSEVERKRFDTVSRGSSDAPPSGQRSVSLERLRTPRQGTSISNSASQIVQSSIPVAENAAPIEIDHDEDTTDEEPYEETELDGLEENKSIILHLLSQLKLGMDLTKVTLPTFILERRSLLEMFADCMAHPDMFVRIADETSPEKRMLAMFEWYLTSFHEGRKGSIAKKPYNPIIGETFHCSWSVDVQDQPCQVVFVAEQVSHHPPVSAFYVECPSKGISMNGSIYTKSKFMGMSIGVQMVGRVVLKLLNPDEEYVFTLPSAYARSILTTPWVELGDKVTVNCPQTGYSASIVFHTRPFYGGKLHRISGEVRASSGDVIYRAAGEWNGVIQITDCTSEPEATHSIDTAALRVIRKRVRPLEKQAPTESRRLWNGVTKALRENDLSHATEHKYKLEEEQRAGERRRKETKAKYPTKFFDELNEEWLYKKPLRQPSEPTSRQPSPSQ